MISTELARLERLADTLRALVIRSVARAHGGHIGGPLSAAEILVSLYFDVLRIRPDEPDWPDRDRFILSKGHSAIALYAALALRGFFPVDELETFDQLDSRLQGHPDMTRLPGLDMSTGSLGMGLSAGLGIALGARLRGGSEHTFVLLGDGECQEGQVWEAAAVAARYDIDNLTAIVDVNGLQQYGWPGPTPETRARPWGEGQLPRLWAAFGWRVVTVDGHDIAQLAHAIRSAASTSDRPAVVLASTVKGKGVSFMEGDFRWHARVPTDAELDQAIAELGVD
jgi:transketolase